MMYLILICLVVFKRKVERRKGTGCHFAKLFSSLAPLDYDQGMRWHVACHTIYVVVLPCFIIYVYMHYYGTITMQPLIAIKKILLMLTLSLSC